MATSTGMAQRGAGGCGSDRWLLCCFEQSPAVLTSSPPDKSGGDGLYTSRHSNEVAMVSSRSASRS